MAKAQFERLRLTDNLPINQCNTFTQPINVPNSTSNENAICSIAEIHQKLQSVFVRVSVEKKNPSTIIMSFCVG
jgi:hypothetical protein